MHGLAFEKYEGLGNDFLVVLADALPDASPDGMSRVARALCDRRRGVGGDGVLVVSPGGGGVDGAVARMRVHNADGTVPEMCGNGLRCVAVSLVARGLARENEPFLVGTDAGPLRCRVVGEDVEVEMGRAVSTGPVTITVGGSELALETVSTGNPHAVHFGELDEAAVDALGPLVATHAAFPAGTNAGFARLGDRGIDLVVWERGVGKTLACGTGACAAAFAACVRGALPFDEPVPVRLPGGELRITVSRDGDVRMRGPARHVFRGEAT